MHVTAVPCLRDNYAYVIHADGSSEAAVVDPSEAEPVLDVLERQGLTLVAILNTHHHWDHVGGNQALIERLGPLRVYGHRSDEGRIPGQTERLDHEQRVREVGLDFRILHIPGHTTGAVAYVVEGAAFTGDTLFAAGCGRLFEGTAAMMYTSLNEILGSLPDETLVYCGHEYTEQNLRFALHVEPGNAAARDKAARVAELRKRGEPTVPSTIGEERQTNPFMRCDRAEIIEAVGARPGDDPASVLGAVRAAKDAF